jgi:hypothetical protein
MCKQTKRNRSRRQQKPGKDLFHNKFGSQRKRSSSQSTQTMFEKNTGRFINRLYRGILHSKQIESLRLLMMAVLFSSVLGIAAVGTGMAQWFGKKAKHGIKQLDRHLSQVRVPLSTYYSQTVQFLIGRFKDVFVTLDWTDFAGDKQTTLVAALVWKGKRTPPLVWMTVRKTTLKGKQKQYEKKVLQKLKDVLPEGVTVTVVADRGFGDVALFEYIQSIGFDFVIRFRKGIYVGYKKTWLIQAAWLVPRNGRILVIHDEVLTAKEKGPYTVVLTKARGMKEPWCLATNRKVIDGRNIVTIYGKRFQCEETFRDIKNHRYGYGFHLTSIQSPNRRDRFLLLFTLAYILLLLMGVVSERLGLDKFLRANTVKRRTHSLFRQGLALKGRVAKSLYLRLQDSMTTILNEFLFYGIEKVLL